MCNTLVSNPVENKQVFQLEIHQRETPETECPFFPHHSLRWCVQWDSGQKVTKHIQESNDKKMGEMLKSLCCRNVTLSPYYLYNNPWCVKCAVYEDVYK